MGVVEAYERGGEEERLTTNKARRLEWLTTIRALEAHIPPGARILDCAAGTGVYALHFAEKGHPTTATDVTPRHIAVLDRRLADKPYTMRTAVRDATDLSCFADATFDVVLCMGPHYHLPDAVARRRCLDECLRVLKGDGLLAVAYLSRFAVFPYLVDHDFRYLAESLADKLLASGAITADDPDCFWTDTYFAAPAEMNDLFITMGLETVDHFAADGLTPFLRGKVDAMDEAAFAVWTDYHYRVCREPSLLGASNHNMIIGRRRKAV